MEDTGKKIEVANTTLNRLMAGDFLESLGKELGLMLPPEMPLPENKAVVKIAQKESLNVDKGNGDSVLSEKKMPASHTVLENSNVLLNKNNTVDGSKIAEIGSIGEEREMKTRRSRNHNPSSSSSEDERRRKRSRSHRHKSSRNSSSDSDASNGSDDYREHRSRSRRKDKGSSGDSRRHSKHRKHRKKDSHSRSSGKEHGNHKRKKSRYEE